MSKPLKIYYGIVGIVIIGLISLFTFQYLHNKAVINNYFTHHSINQTPNLLAASNAMSNNNLKTWNNYCSAYQSLCFRYPKNWQLHSASNSLSYTGVVLTDPSKQVALYYNPIEETSQNPCQTSCAFNIKQIEHIKRFPNTMLIQGVSSINNNYFAIKAIGNSNFLSSNHLQIYKNNKINSTINLITFGSIKYPKEQIGFYALPYSNSPFATNTTATKWLNSPIQKTVNQILTSLTYTK